MKELQEIWVVLKMTFMKCDCYDSHLFMERKYINPHTNLWEYNIRCGYCGKIHFKSDKGK
jgi:hypothetical protein